jgi:prepilin-type N-terminal cleavage/methylation domain-containing protein
MRKGISLVEMMIGIVLFAALSTIALKYAKNYLNTDLQASKARTAAAMEEASQLTSAYKLFTTQYGQLSLISELNATATQVITAIPLKITEMSSAGWDYNSSIDGAGLKAFHMTLDGNTTLTSDEQYCALWNREFNASVEQNVTQDQNFGTIAGMKGSMSSFCAGTAGTYDIYVTLP